MWAGLAWLQLPKGLLPMAAKGVCCVLQSYKAKVFQDILVPQHMKAVERYLSVRDPRCGGARTALRGSADDGAGTQGPPLRGSADLRGSASTQNETLGNTVKQRLARNQAI